MRTLPGELVTASFVKGTGDEVMIRKVRVRGSQYQYNVYLSGKLVGIRVVPADAYMLAEKHGYTFPERDLESSMGG
jgi:hypothetical protein